MELNAFTAISPVDGRYRTQTADLAEFFSEFGLIKYRVLIEVEYFIALCELPLPQLAEITKDGKKIYTDLRNLYLAFSMADAQKVKDFEKTTNHDVKAVEYLIKEKFDALGLAKFKEFIHFGLTSQDINNTAVPYSLMDAMNRVYYPTVQSLLEKLIQLAVEWKDVSMLAHTHGQPASPTKVGKEIAVFIERAEKQLGMLKIIPFSAKFGGATGNLNAHYAAYPSINWNEFATSFVNYVLVLDRSQTTTQIEHYDNFAAMCDNMKRINTIFIDLARDMWTYISMEYFKQRINKNEVGSSTMPHKVNPIDFENAEGNFGMANALFEHFSAKLPISRLQRDLTDSTVLRNIGVPIAHTLIGFKSLIKGLNKIILNEKAIDADLENNWSVVSEAIQTILRREFYPKPYEALKELTRTNSKIDAKAIADFIDTLNVSPIVKEELKSITPQNYTGFTSVR